MDGWLPLSDNKHKSLKLQKNNKDFKQWMSSYFACVESHKYMFQQQQQYNLYNNKVKAKLDAVTAKPLLTVVNV